MTPRAERIRYALGLFEEGDRAAAAGDWRRAHALYTEGHDLAVDSPPHHRLAHEKLLPANEALGDEKEARTDRILLKLAPYGVFTLIAPFLRPTALPAEARGRGRG